MGNGQMTVQTFRKALGFFVSGVTVITVEHRGQARGMTASAVSSLSIDPLQLLVCIERTAKMSDYLQVGTRFVVNILAADQEDLSNYFAGMPVDSPPSFSFCDWDGAPRLSDCLAAIRCRVADRLPGGDHWIITAATLDFVQPGDSEREPLIYYRSGYGLNKD